MKFDLKTCALLSLLLLVTCLLPIDCKGGRGGGSRGGGSRGSSGNRRGGTDYNRRNRPSNPPAPPRYQPPPPPPKYEAPKVKPSAPEAPNTKVVQQPASNPNFKESNPYQNSGAQPGVNQKPPPYQPQERPPPYSPAGAPPPYSPGGQPYRPPAGAPPAYPGQTGGGPPYPVQPGSYPRQPGGGPPYPVQPGSYPRQPGGAPPYPVQPGSSYPRQPYPVQPGSYPRQNYPYPQQPGMSPHQLGANVWSPNVGRPAPSFMKSGGLPTGTNMGTMPYKKKGFLGSIFSMGGKSGGMKKQKYGSQMNPYGMASMGGRSAAMHTMLPYGASRMGGGFKPKFKPGFGMGMGMGMLGSFMLMRAFSGIGHMGHHGYGYGHGGYGYGHGSFEQRRHYYDVYNDEYIGGCNRPLTPVHGKIHCVSTESQVTCNAECKEGYQFPDQSTGKENKCWHVTGVWRPKKNFPACEPVCNVPCHNNGTCVGPDICGCPPEYRGTLCEFHFLQCDIRKFAGPNVGWSCNHSKNESVCSLTCKPPASFVNPVEGDFHCFPNGTWVPNAVPKCIAEEKKTCTERPDQGPCDAYIFPLFHYDPETETCKEFVYGGCLGNGNRYKSGEECMENCKGKIKALGEVDSSR